MSILRVGPPRFTKRTLRRLIVTGLALCTGWLMVSLAVVYLLTHRLSARFAEPAPSVSWGRLETHRLATRDGQDIGAWFVDGRPGAASILLLHGHLRRADDQHARPRRLDGQFR